MRLSLAIPFALLVSTALSAVPQAQPGDSSLTIPDETVEDKAGIDTLTDVEKNAVLTKRGFQLPFGHWVDKVKKVFKPQPKGDPLAHFWEDAERMKDDLLKFSQKELDDAKKKYEDVSDSIDELRRSVELIVARGADLRHEFERVSVNHGAKRDGNLKATFTWESLGVELEKACNAALVELESAFPPPGEANGHAKRREVVLRLLDAIEERFVKIAESHGVHEKHVRHFFGAIREPVVTIVVTTGDLVEQHPVLASVLISSVVGLILPESLLLRPLLSLFGFGPLGPVKGSWAAFIQSRLYGAVVPAKSWFSFLQRQGMVQVGRKWWVGLVGAVGGIFGGSKTVSHCGRRK